MSVPNLPVHVFEHRPALGHVNLMVDTFIMNTNVEDLRAIVRGVLGMSPPAVTAAFLEVARSRLSQERGSTASATTQFFTTRPTDGLLTPAPELHTFLARVRALYGAGLGFRSLGRLAAVVRATVGLQWGNNAELEAIFAAIDADISQAVQSSREELQSGRVTDIDSAREEANDLRSALMDSLHDVEKWGGQYPFEQGVIALDFWKF